MNGRGRLVVAGAVLVAAWGLAAGAWAQGQSARSFRGIFGGNEADPKSRQSLDLSMSLTGAYDDNVLAGAGSGGAGGGLGGGLGIDPRFQRSGEFGIGDVSLSYRRRVERFTLQMAGGANYRYYPDPGELTSVSQWASLGLDARLGERTSLGLSAGASNSPYYGFGLFPGLSVVAPGEVALPVFDFVVYEQPTIGTQAGLTFRRQLTRRATLAFDGHYRRVEFGEGPLADRGGRGVDDWRAGGRFTYALTRHASARLGYFYREGQYGGAFFGGQPIKGHEIDVGVDYSRALSLTRRTQIGFSTGSTIVQTPYGYGGASGERGEYTTRYGVSATAFLTREIGQSWTARLNYQRGLYFVESIGEPFFNDAVSLSAGGYAGRRVRLNVSAAYTRGEAGYNASDRQFGTMTGQAGVQVAVTRYAAVSAQYLYYRYDFESGVPLPSGFGREFDRQGVRVGLNLWLPLLR